MDTDGLVLQEGRSRVGQRRVVLVPQEGTPESIQDREPPISAPVSTVLASSAVRRLVREHSANRFEALRDLEEVRERRSETGSADGHVFVPMLMKERLRWTTFHPQEQAGARNVAIGMASLDEFRLPEIFKHRARVMQTVPLLLKGAFRGALRVAFEEVQCPQDNKHEVRHGRAWKLFMLLPPMLLSRSPRGTRPKEAVGRTFPDVWCRQWAD